MKQDTQKHSMTKMTTGTGVWLTELLLMGVLLMGVLLMGVLLTGVLLTGVLLTGVLLTCAEALVVKVDSSIS